MKYIRTEDGRIINIQEFIDAEKNNPYYKEHKFKKIKNENGECVIRWTAVGTEENSIKEQRGQRCQFGARIDSPFVKQSNKLEDLIDYYICIDVFNQDHFVEGKIPFDNVKNTFKGMKIYAGILTDKGLIFAAKMNDKGKLKLL